MAVTEVKKQPRFEQFTAVRRFAPVLAFTPDGSQLYFSSNISGQFNLWRIPVEGGWPEQLTSFTGETVRLLAVSPRDGTLAFCADTDGDEFHQIYVLPPEGGWPEQWTDAPQVQHYVSPDSWSPDGSRLAYAANARTPTDLESWVRDARSGETRPIFGEGKATTTAAWSPDGSSLLVVDQRHNSDTSVHLVDVESGEATELTPHDEEARFSPGPWAPDGSGFYLLTDEGREFIGLAFYTLARRGYEWLETPDRDIEDVALSEDGRVLGWIENVSGREQLRLRDLESGADLPEPQLPPGTRPYLLGMVGGLALSPDGRYAAIVWTTPQRPQEIWIVETQTGAARAITESRFGGLRENDLGDAELVRFPTFDGREIEAWLYRPDEAGPVPVVLSIHGGPEAQEKPIYSPLYQYLRSRGIAVLAPNIRGSTGYGKTYQKLIQRDWGGGDLQDFEHAVKWLHDQDWVDRDRIGVYGGSFGGFATLSCVTRLPDYWAAAVDIVGPSNLVTFAKAVPPTWRRFMARFVGDPETEADFLMERSPITYVDNVRTPLLVIQGAKDPRVVKGESDQMVEKLRSLGRTVEYVVFDDEGHGFTKRENEVRALRLTAEWFERHLVGDAA
ncbi:MAG: S9 family peptidase [Actinomycetota bacterium]|nr:S9 family peptidase [Actinomycetota bacterium]